jgi:hypothetical protein
MRRESNMPAFKVRVEIGGASFEIKTTAKTLKKAWEKIDNMSMIDFLATKKVKDFGGVWSASLVTTPKKEKTCP